MKINELSRIIYEEVKNVLAEISKQQAIRINTTGNVRIWINQNDLEFDSVIENIKKKNISIEDKIKLAKSRTIEIAEEQINNLSNDTISVQILLNISESDIDLDRIDWETLLAL